MFNEIIKNGGGTLNKKGVVTFEKGYMVRAQNLATIEYGAHDLYTIIEIWYMKYKRNYKGLLGLWINEGKLYIDLVEHVEDKNEALVLGRMNEEIAIWDCKNNVEVKV